MLKKKTSIAEPMTNKKGITAMIFFIRIAESWFLLPAYHWYTMIRLKCLKHKYFDGLLIESSQVFRYLCIVLHDLHL